MEGGGCDHLIVFGRLAIGWQGKGIMRKISSVPFYLSALITNQVLEDAEGLRLRVPRLTATANYMYLSYRTHFTAVPAADTGGLASEWWIPAH
jgi:hypothetical protein